MVNLVRFIVGAKGSGKTKWLIGRANEEIRKKNEGIVFIDVEDNHIFNLSYLVRLINAMEFNIDNIESFYGFLCGIIGMDYDVEEIYVDGLYKVFPLNGDELLDFKRKLMIIAEKFNVKFYIGSDLNSKEIPIDLKPNCFQLEIE